MKKKQRESGTSNSAQTGGALVTGAGKRLGRAIALGLADDGWDVVVHYNRSGSAAQQTVADIKARGRNAVAIGADLSDPQAVETLFEQANDAIALRCVVNNASLFESDRPASFTADSLSRHIGPNMAAPLQLTRLLAGALQPDGRGVVINILDQKLSNLNPDFFSYTLSKAGLHAGTQMCAMAFAPVLRVVGVSPGLTLPSYLQDEQSFANAHSQSALLDSSSHPEDIVAAVVFLACQPAITGVNLTVDGGQHLTGLGRDVSYVDFGD